MEKKEPIDDLVTLIDQFMEQGGSHMNVDADMLKDGMSIEKNRSRACSVGKWASACAVPTFMGDPDVDDKN